MFMPLSPSLSWTKNKLPYRVVDYRLINFLQHIVGETKILCVSCAASVLSEKDTQDEVISSHITMSSFVIHDELRQQQDDIITSSLGVESSIDMSLFSLRTPSIVSHACLAGSGSLSSCSRRLLMMHHLRWIFCQWRCSRKALFATTTGTSTSPI